jgi:hypothetical protein
MKSKLVVVLLQGALTAGTLVRTRWNQTIPYAWREDRTAADVWGWGAGIVGTALGIWLLFSGAGYV